MLLLFAMVDGARGGEVEPFEFDFEGNRLRGLIETPTGSPVTALIVIVHGHGRSNVQGGQWIDLRSTFAEMGIATALWDKAGCGESDGNYDPRQSVQSGSREALAAIEELRRRGAPGVERIGLWGISRAGWICPLVIQEDPSIAFWISVSGTDEKESFGYLLRSNLEIEGRSADEIDALYNEWLESSRIFLSGGPWSAYRDASRRLRTDPFYAEFFGSDDSEKAYRQNQAEILRPSTLTDPETGLLLYVPDFPQVLSSIRCPVLALFGEKDRNVDWRSARRLYRETIDEARLTVKTFPNGNHNIQKSDTDGLREMIANSAEWQPCDGYYETMIGWLQEILNTTAHAAGASTPGKVEP